MNFNILVLGEKKSGKTAFIKTFLKYFQSFSPKSNSCQECQNQSQQSSSVSIDKESINHKCPFFDNKNRIPVSRKSTSNTNSDLNSNTNSNHSDKYKPQLY
jgi:septin family protein